MSAVRVMIDGKPAWRQFRDPYWSLTQRQREVLDRVRAFGGNRSRAARSLWISTTSVQSSLRLAGRAGVSLPKAPNNGAGRGPDLKPRTRTKS